MNSSNFLHKHSSASTPQLNSSSEFPSLPNPSHSFRQENANFSSNFAMVPSPSQSCPTTNISYLPKMSSNDPSFPSVSNSLIDLTADGNYALSTTNVPNSYDNSKSPVPLMELELGMNQESMKLLQKQVMEEHVKRSTANYVKMSYEEAPMSKKRKYKTYASSNNNHGEPTWARHYIISTGNDEFKNKCPIRLCKALKQIIGPALNIKKNSQGKIHVECADPEQANKLINLTVLGDTQITVTPNKALNTSKGVVTCRDLEISEEAEILEELREQGVEEVRRIKRRENGILKNTASLVLTFNCPRPPQAISIAYHLKVRPYVPPPMRCFQCLRLGHTAIKCKVGTKMCGCGEPIGLDPDHHQCRVPPKCINCGAEHNSRSNDCEVLKEEKEILKLKVEKNLPYAEARNIVRSAAFVRPQMSFAATTRKEKREISTQTGTTNNQFIFQAASHLTSSQNPVSAPPSAVVEATITKLLATLDQCYGIRVAIPTGPIPTNPPHSGEVSGVSASTQPAVAGEGVETEVTGDSNLSHSEEGFRESAPSSASGVDPHGAVSGVRVRTSPTSGVKPENTKKNSPKLPNTNRTTDKNGPPKGKRAPGRPSSSRSLRKATTPPSRGSR